MRLREKRKRLKKLGRINKVVMEFQFQRLSKTLKKVGSVVMIEDAKNTLATLSFKVIIFAK